jgi:hypothetical protein
MLAPLKRELGKNRKTLIVKTVVGIMKATNANLVNLFDVDTILGLPCVLLVLEYVNALLKFV